MNGKFSGFQTTHDDYISTEMIQSNYKDPPTSSRLKKMYELKVCHRNPSMTADRKALKAYSVVSQLKTHERLQRQ